ncbi:hypothetical protein BO94DRAFT_572988 [Aspergillus sclerotioniger CBS 115572]|uniref:Transcription factor domain-containing protein n=1 Tax=Aspergillus sclerotioniger CBS 115572 TaxID=1450535 RepID=A0A317XAL0_9EURO|nr:hypothetical protein BO94DRAFT_572988 [Aspergillus sclerotioniger CBS 115572]PWY93560.1 hypothetical protein BO94DRAFT_572988 [Aspergillus sclerotioniger CBS 115572]
MVSFPDLVSVFDPIILTVSSFTCPSFNLGYWSRELPESSVFVFQGLRPCIVQIIGPLHNHDSACKHSSPDDTAADSVPHLRDGLPSQRRQGLATWMDVFDLGGTYQRKVARRDLTSDLLLRCICAFTARQLCLRASGETWAPVATNYYRQSLHLLIQQLNSSEPLRDTLTAVILLGSYEVLAAQGQEHHRHYEGALKLIQIRGISARSVGLDRANFWIWVRHELTIAITNKTPLQLDPSDGNVNWRKGETAEDLAVNWVYKDRTPSEYHELLVGIEIWYTGLFQHLRGVKYGKPVEDGLFKVHFAVLQTGSFTANTCRSLLPLIQDHATEIINISISDIPDQVLCSSILPLYFGCGEQGFPSAQPYLSHTPGG